MAAIVCWMVVDFKGMPLGIGFTKVQAKYDAADYLLAASSKDMTFNQAMSAINKRLGHRELVFRQYKLLQIEETDGSEKLVETIWPPKIKKAWAEYQVRQKEIDAHVAQVQDLINKNNRLKEEKKQLYLRIKELENQREQSCSAGLKP